MCFQMGFEIHTISNASSDFVFKILPNFKDIVHEALMALSCLETFLIGPISVQ